MSPSSSTTSSSGRPRPGQRFLATLTFTLLLTIGLTAAVNVAVDPFGYFGLNQTGLFFNDERAFKLVQVRRFPHDALLLGDSRPAYIDTTPIARPRFFNAGFSGASLEELLWFWEHYQGHATVVVIGLLAGDVNGEPVLSEQFASRSWRDTFRYALSFELLAKSAEAVRRWRAAEPPLYHDNGARIIADKYIRHTLTMGSPGPAVMSPYVHGSIRADPPVVNLCADVPAGGVEPPGVEAGLRRIGRMAELAAQRRAKLILFLQPRPRELVAATGYEPPPPILTAYACHLGLDLYDLSASYGATANFWPSDMAHYFPHVGVALLEEILRVSGVPVELR